jgi:ParB-like nuclease domain
MLLREFFEAAGNEVAIIFGRFNPPHKGHRAAWEVAAKSPVWYVGTHKATVGPKDPLPFDVKIKCMEAIWPEVASHVVAETSWLTMASMVYEKHKASVLYCCTDEDWVTKTVIQYNGKEGAHGYYNFASIEQKPTPRLSSATDLRSAVMLGDRNAFTKAAGVNADLEINGTPFFDLVAKYLLPYADTKSGKSSKASAKLKEVNKAMSIREGDGERLSIEQLAHISDEALDNAYHYGRSTPGNTFGWQANLKSAEYAKRVIDNGETELEIIADAIHDGWNETARAFVQNPGQFDDTEKLMAAGKLDAKIAQREKLMNISYDKLPSDEQEKDLVVARALLAALTDSKKKVSESKIDEVADQPYRYMLTKKLPDARQYMFQTDSGTKFQVFFSLLDSGTEKIADVGFADQTDKDNPTIGVTGKGDAFRVFSTVGAIVKEYVNSVKPDFLSFNGKTQDPGRIKLYNMIAKNITRYLKDYEQSSHTMPGASDEKGYMLQRITHDVKEDNFSSWKMYSLSNGKYTYHGQNKDKMIAQDLIKRAKRKDRLNGIDREWILSLKPLDENVDEVSKVSLSSDPDNFGAWVRDGGTPEKTVVIPTSKIHVFEPDSKFDDPHHAKNLANIVKAIKAGKKLPPILVRRHGIDRFQVVDGHHRFMAYRMAGAKSIPARVVDPKNVTGDVDEGWKSKLAGAAMVGLGALGAAGHAKADDQGAGAKAPTQTSQSAGGLQWLDDPTVPDNLPGKVAGSRFPTRAPVGTKYGSFMNDKGEKINAYVDSDLTSRFVPDKEGEWKPQKFPTNAKVGTKYGSFTNDKGELIDKYVDHDLTTRFQKASDGPWKPR